MKAFTALAVETPVGSPIVTWTDKVDSAGLYWSPASPETVVAANVGSVCIALSNATVYKKVTGTGNTGWQSITNPTGTTRKDGQDTLSADTFVVDFDSGSYDNKKVSWTADHTVAMTSTDTGGVFVLTIVSDGNGQEITWPGNVIGAGRTTIITTDGTDFQFYYDGTNFLMLNGKDVPLVVDSIADLLSIDAHNGQQATTRGYSVAGIGSNTYKYDADATATCDGGWTLDGPGGSNAGATSAATYAGSSTLGRWLAVDQSVADAKQFGAKGDAITNDTFRVTAALVSGAGTVDLTGGNYGIDPLTITESNVVIKGNLVALSSSATQALVSLSSCTDLTVSLDITEAVGYSTQSQGLIRAINGSRLTFTDCYLHETSDFGIILTTCDNCIVSNNRFIDWSGGFQIYPTQDCFNIVIEGNVLDDKGNASSVAIHAITLATGVTEASGYVVNGNSITCACTPLQCTSVISECVISNNYLKNTNPDTVSSNAIKLNGTLDGVVITGNVLISNRYALFVVADGTTLISNNWIDTPGASGAALASQVATTGTIRFINNWVTGSLRAVSFAGGTSSGHVISGNWFDGHTEDGINIQPLSITDCIIEGNVFTGTGRYAIRLDSDGHIVKNNTFRDGVSPTYGCFFAGDNLKITGNDWSGGTKDFFRFSGSLNCLVSVNDETEVVGGGGGFDIDNTLLIKGQRFITGSPEGVITAPIGELISRLDGTISATLYVKESGTGNTGWVASGGSRKGGADDLGADATGTVSFDFDAGNYDNKIQKLNGTTTATLDKPTRSGRYSIFLSSNSPSTEYVVTWVLGGSATLADSSALPYTSGLQDGRMVILDYDLVNNTWYIDRSLLKDEITINASTLSGTWTPDAQDTMRYVLTGALPPGVTFQVPDNMPYGPEMEIIFANTQGNLPGWNQTAGNYIVHGNRPLQNVGWAIFVISRLSSHYQVSGIDEGVWP